MTTFRTIASTETDPQAPLTSALMKAFEGNTLAIAEGDATAPKIADLALNTGAATTEGTTWVGLRTAALAVGAVGSYALLVFDTPATAAHGTTYAGSLLMYSNAAGSDISTGPSGTWRLMGQTNSAAADRSASLFLRIS